MQNPIQVKKVTPVKLFLPLHELLDSEGSNNGGGGGQGNSVLNKI
jgi:hypothetical protein